MSRINIFQPQHLYVADYRFGVYLTGALLISLSSIRGRSRRTETAVRPPEAIPLQAAIIIGDEATTARLSGQYLN